MIRSFSGRGHLKIIANGNQNTNRNHEWRRAVLAHRRKTSCEMGYPSCISRSRNTNCIYWCPCSHFFSTGPERLPLNFKPLHFSISLLTSSEDRRKMHLSTFITSTVAATASWSNTGEPWPATPTETTTPFRQPLGCDLQQLQSCLPGCASGALPCQRQCYNLAHCHAPTASKILVTRQVAMDDTSEARPTGCVKQKKTLVTRQVAIDDTPGARPTGCAQ